MDEEDLLDSKKKFKIPKVYDKRFKISFLWIFIVCVFLMVSDQIMKYLDHCPELFPGADYVFHVFQSSIAISSQLSVSVAAAVIFYYVIEFINAKKRINDITEIRKFLLYILYRHMNIICNTNSFKKLNRDKKRLIGPAKLFLIMDVPILLECYNICDKEKLPSELTNYFLEAHKDTERRRLLLLDLQGFQKDILCLLENKRFSFYKGYMQDIEGLKSIYEEIDGYTTIYKEENNTECFNMIIDYYLTFLDESIHIYHIAERYIECLEDKHFVEFMRLMD